MKTILRMLLVLGLSLGFTTTAWAHIFDLKRQQETSLELVLADLTTVRTIFIGELHDNQAHHQAQLQLIQALHQAGVVLSVGLEMFRQDGQEQLDQWFEGKIDEKRFAGIFEEHWSLWEQYREIFLYARDKGIPLVGLNIRRELVNQVARQGFTSLSPEQRSALPIAGCNVNPAYRDFIRRAFNGHGDHGAEFEHFCEAQMLWDASMAKTLADYLERNPRRTVVVLAGNGHSWKHGIPEQLGLLGSHSSRVLLPETQGRTDLQTISFEDADYLLQGLDQGPLH